MEYVKRLEDIKVKKSGVVTLGKFDGVHRGHRKLIERVLQIGKKEDCETAVFTFDVSPQVRMGSAKAKMLMTNEERRSLLKEIGVDLLVECPFTEAVQNMEAEEFVEKVLIGRLRMKYAVVGTDFHFGRGRRGNPEFLRRMGKEMDFSVEIVQKEKDGSRDISSTYVREELEAGRMENVRRLLGAGEAAAALGRLHLPNQGRGKALQQRDKHRQKAHGTGKRTGSRDLSV